MDGFFMRHYHFSRHLSETLEGKTPKEKHPFLFQKKFNPRQKNFKGREANFAKYFPPNPQHFAKFRSRSVFLHSASFAPKTLWRSAERSPTLLLQQKHHALRGGA